MESRTKRDKDEITLRNNVALKDERINHFIQKILGPELEEESNAESLIELLINEMNENISEFSNESGGEEEEQDPS